MYFSLPLHPSPALKAIKYKKQKKNMENWGGWGEESADPVTKYDSNKKTLFKNDWLSHLIPSFLFSYKWSFPIGGQQHRKFTASFQVGPSLVCQKEMMWWMWGDAV